MGRINWNKNALDSIEDQLAKSLYQEGDLLIADSQTKVPVNTGTLRSTGFVEPPTQTNKKISVKVGYGGPATKVNSRTGQATTEYAIRVHEDLQAKHNVGEAKFLEKPAKELESKLGEHLARRMKI